MDRRDFFQGTAAAAAAATLAGCASTGATTRTAGGKPLFDVPDTYVPVVGSSEVFPVRRIYCIGRNYAAHSREMGSDPNRE